MKTPLAVAFTILLAAAFAQNPPALTKGKLTLTHQLLTREHQIINGANESTPTPGQIAQLALLDQIVAESSERIRRLGPTESPKERAQAICQIVHTVLRDHRFRVRVPTESLTDALQPTASGDHFFDCDTGSMIYLAVLETLGQPATMVDVPRHNFIRLTLADGSTFNWDTNLHTSVSDATYRSGGAGGGAFSPEAERLNHYLVSMSADEVRAYHTGISYDLFQKSGQAERGVRELKEAVSTLPSHATIRNNLAWLIATDAVLQEKHYLDLALEMATSAVKLYPSNNLIDTLAAVHAARGEFEQAIAAEMSGAKRESRLEAYRNRKTPVELNWKDEASQ